MDILSIILIAIGLAMDCLAVSLTQGLAEKRWNNEVLLMALFFGLFQGAMPLFGYSFGTIFTAFISQFSPWIALILLAFIGGKMIWESTRKSDQQEVSAANWALTTLFMLAVATSIDALVTGLLFIPHPELLWGGISIIALVSFLFSLAGYLIGIYAGKKIHFNAELLGGFILVGIGLKIFIEGVCF